MGRIRLGTLVMVRDDDGSFAHVEDIWTRASLIAHVGEVGYATSYEVAGSQDYVNVLYTDGSELRAISVTELVAVGTLKDVFLAEGQVRASTPVERTAFGLAASAALIDDCEECVVTDAEGRVHGVVVLPGGEYAAAMLDGEDLTVYAVR